MNFALAQFMLMMNHNFRRLDRFDGHNFHRWQQKILISPNSPELGVVMTLGRSVIFAQLIPHRSLSTLHWLWWAKRLNG